jgi:hypothetical protein
MPRWSRSPRSAGSGVRHVTWSTLEGQITGQIPWSEFYREPPAPPHVQQLLHDVGGVEDFYASPLGLRFDHFTAARRRTGDQRSPVGRDGPASRPPPDDRPPREIAPMLVPCPPVQVGRNSGASPWDVAGHLTIQRSASSQESSVRHCQDDHLCQGVAVNRVDVPFWIPGLFFAIVVATIVLRQGL